MRRHVEEIEERGYGHLLLTARTDPLPRRRVYARARAWPLRAGRQPESGWLRRRSTRHPATSPGIRMAMPRICHCSITPMAKSGWRRFMTSFAPVPLSASTIVWRFPWETRETRGSFPGDTGMRSHDNAAYVPDFSRIGFRMSLPGYWNNCSHRRNRFKGCTGSMPRCNELNRS